MREPVWDTADRMRKALQVSGIRCQDMAKRLGVSRGTVGNWINGRTSPRVAVLRLWALETGVSFDWLRDGE